MTLLGDELTDALNAFKAYFGYSASLAESGPRARIEAELQRRATVDMMRGLADGLLDALNPLNNFYDIPDMGALYGNTDAHALAKTVGTVIGTGFSFVSGFGALGLGVGCGSKLAVGVLPDKNEPLSANTRGSLINLVD